MKSLKVKILMGLCFVVIMTIIVIYENQRTFDKCSVEAGVIVVPADFLRIEDEDAYFTDDSETINIKVPGEYNLKIKTGLFVHNVVLHIEDTISPEVKLKEKKIMFGETLTIQDFIEEIEDKTKTEIRYVNEPDFNILGNQSITIQVEDAAKNKVTKETVLTISPVKYRLVYEIGGVLPTVKDFLCNGVSGNFVTDISSIDFNTPGVYPIFVKVGDEQFETSLKVEDTVAPVFEAAEDFTVSKGENVSYLSYVRVSDNGINKPVITVNTNQADINKEGVYPIIYTASDPSGNESVATVYMTVKEKVFTPQEEYVENRLNEIISGIINGNMTKYERCEAVFNYVHNSIQYKETDAASETEALYYSLTTGSGDCYNYASMSKALLTKAQVANMMISKIPSKTEHYWNLVDTGDGHGWYHFDATRRYDKTIIFMWDEATLQNYSNTHGGSHNYDKTLYPKID